MVVVVFVVIGGVLASPPELAHCAHPPLLRKQSNFQLFFKRTPQLILIVMVALCIWLIDQFNVLCLY